MAPKYRISRHLLFFALVVSVFTLVLYSRNTDQYILQVMYLTSVNALFFMGYAYLTIFILIPYFLPRRCYWRFGLSLLTFGLLLSAIKLNISDFIFYSSISPEFMGSEGILNVRYVLINTKDMSFIVALFTIAKFTKDWLITEHERIRLQKKYAELKLRLLQSHFEPHFLFNTLNNLYSLSLRQPDETLEVIRKFKRVLWFSIGDAQMKKVKLRDEVAMISDFIAIEQMRYGERLQVKYTVSGSCENQLIAPFVLFTVVENCFRHGSSPDAGHPWIELSLQCGKSEIIFTAKNSIPQKCRSVSGFQERGLLRLRQRLDFIYPKRYNLTLNEEPQIFEVKLEIDLN